MSYGNTSTEIHDGSTGASLNTNYTTDPSFVSGTSPYDLSLQSTSTAIDTGTNLASTGDDDIDGNSRPYNVDYDIGAYEYQGSAKRRGGEASTIAEEVHVYPNPFSQQLLVELNAEESVGLELYNLQNQRMEISATRDNFSWLIETGDLASGVYILKVQGPTWVRCFKVLKE